MKMDESYADCLKHFFYRVDLEGSLQMMRKSGSTKLGGKIPKRWSLAAVVPYICQWIHRFGTESAKRRVRKGGEVELLKHWWRSR